MGIVSHLLDQHPSGMHVFSNIYFLELTSALSRITAETIDDPLDIVMLVFGSVKNVNISGIMTTLLQCFLQHNNIIMVYIKEGEEPC